MSSKRKTIRSLSALLVVLTVSGCSGPTLREQLDAEEGDRLAAYAVLKQHDAKAALRLAEIAKDHRAIRCYNALIPILEELEDYRREAEAFEAEGTGVITLYQRARNIRRFVEDPPEELDACAIMFGDSRDTILGIARRLR